MNYIYHNWMALRVKNKEITEVEAIDEVAEEASLEYSALCLSPNSIEYEQGWEHYQSEEEYKFITALKIIDLLTE